MAYEHHVTLADTAPPTVRSWFVVPTAILFFCYEFIQMNMFHAISVSLLRAFHINATQLRTLSSFYFIVSIMFLLIAGILFNRCSTRRLILASLGMGILGTILFSTATSFGFACCYCFLIGVSSAFCFLSIVRLFVHWVSLKRMLLIIGLVVVMTMVISWIAHVPITWLVHTAGWRRALRIDGFLGMFLFVFIIIHSRNSCVYFKNGVQFLNII